VKRIRTAWAWLTGRLSCERCGRPIDINGGIAAVCSIHYAERLQESAEMWANWDETVEKMCKVLAAASDPAGDADA
jgi:hypothetical protein